MIIYIVTDNPPEDFGTPEIYGIFLGNKNATDYMNILRSEDPYKYQYTYVLNKKVMDYPK